MALEVQKVHLLYSGGGLLEKQRKKERLRLIQEGVNCINALEKNDFVPQHEMEGRNVGEGEKIVQHARKLTDKQKPVACLTRDSNPWPGLAPIN